MTNTARNFAAQRILGGTIVVGATALWLAACGGGGATMVAQASMKPQPAPSSVPPAEVDSPFGSYLAGRLARLDSDLAAAAHYFSRALAEDPENAELLRQTYLAFHAEGRMKEAVALARRLVELKPTEPFAGMTLALESVRNGDLDAASARLEGLSKRGYNALLVPLITAWTLAGQERFDDAREVLTGLDKSEVFEVFRDYHAALIDDIAGNTVDAEQAYRSSLEAQTRSNFRVVAALGSFLERDGRPQAALELYESYQDENPNSVGFEPAVARLAAGDLPKRLVGNAREGAAETLFGVASTLYRENALGVALLYARAALHLRADLDVAHVLLGEILEAKQRPAEAIVAYRAIPWSSPLSWMVRQRIATNLDELDRTEEAVDELRKLAAERPDRADALTALGDLLRFKERWAEAVEAYDQALARIEVLEKRHWRALYARGIALERSKEWPRAERDFLKALDLEPDQPYVLNYLGYSWVDKGVNLARALEMIERAVELRPSDGYIMDSLGWAFYRLERFDDAVNRLEQAVELRPEDPTINDHLGDAYWRVGRRVEARFQWRRALGFEPEEAETVAEIQAKLLNGLTPDAVADGGG